MDKRWNISKYIVKQPMKKQEDNRDGYPLALGVRLGSGQGGTGTGQYYAKYREQTFFRVKISYKFSDIHPKTLGLLIFRVKNDKLN